MSEQPPIDIEALTRLDLRPDEVLAVTLGIPGLKPMQLQEFEEFLTIWLCEHNRPVAGVLVLPQGSQLAAISGRDAAAYRRYRDLIDDKSAERPEPVTRGQVERGEKSINDYRRYLGMPEYSESGPDVTIHVHGNVIGVDQLRQVVRNEMYKHLRQAWLSRPHTQH